MTDSRAFEPSPGAGAADSRGPTAGDQVLAPGDEVALFPPLGGG